MISKEWIAMNALEEAFSEITAFGFMLEQLQEAVDNSDDVATVDITAALNAFYPVYSNNWDKKFKAAWKQVIDDEVPN
jgi:hypothetical protein